MKLVENGDWQSNDDEIGKDVQRCVCVVRSYCVDALPLHAPVPKRLNRDALQDRDEHCLCCPHDDECERQLDREDGAFSDKNPVVLQENRHLGQTKREKVDPDTCPEPRDSQNQGL